MRKAHVWSMVAVFFAIGLVFTGSAYAHAEYDGHVYEVIVGEDILGGCEGCGRDDHGH